MAISHNTKAKILAKIWKDIDIFIPIGGVIAGLLDLKIDVVINDKVLWI